MSFQDTNSSKEKGDALCSLLSELPSSWYERSFEHGDEENTRAAKSYGVLQFGRLVDAHEGNNVFKTEMGSRA